MSPLKRTSRTYGLPQLERPAPATADDIISAHITPYFSSSIYRSQGLLLSQKLVQANLGGEKNIQHAVHRYCVAAISYYSLLADPKLIRLAVREDLCKDFPEMREEDVKAAIRNAFKELRQGASA